METPTQEPSKEPDLTEGNRVPLLEEGRWLRRFAQGLAGSPEDAEDLTQDSMVAALHHGAAVRNPRGFLSEIARRLAAQTRRRGRRRQERERFHFRRAGEHRGGFPGTAEGGYEEAERVDMMRLVLEELRLLPTAQQRAITLSYMDELEPVEIARRLDVSPATVRANLSRGLAALRTRLDRRAGGRGQWLGALGPGLVLPPPIAAPMMGAAMGNLSGAAECGARGAPTSPPAAIAPWSSILIAVVSMKYLVAACIPALLFGLWWAMDDGPTGAPEGQTPDAAPMSEAALVAPDPSGRAPGEAPARTAVAQDVRPGRASAAAAPAAPHSPSDLRLIDRLTGEVVPSMKVRVWRIQEVGSPGTQLESNADGWVTLPPAAPDEVLLLNEYDQGSGLMLGAMSDGGRQGNIRPQDSASYEVEVGPTYRIRFPNSLEVPHERFQSRLVPATEGPATGGSWTNLRPGDLPWVRFPFAATELSPGPFHLRLEDKDGLWLGLAETASNVGIETTPLSPVFEARGVVRFELETHAAPVFSVELEAIDVAPDPWVNARFTIGRHGGGQRVHGIGGLLVPGRYRWTLIGGASAGEVTVEAGKTTTVVLGKNDLGATFNSHVTIDVSANPEANPNEWLLLVTKKDDGTIGYMAKAESTETPHQYRVPLTALAHGTWILSAHPGDRARLDPPAVEIRPGAPAPLMRVAPKLARGGLTVRLKDAATGALIAGGEAGFSSGLTDSGKFERGAGGELKSANVPATESVEIFARAPGYRMAAQSHRLDQDGAELDLLLERGWRGRALVVNAATMSPLSGIPLRAGQRRLGITPRDGWLWIEGDGPPKSIRIDDQDGKYQILNSPYDLEDAALDPLEGWVFVVAKTSK